jgi:hypothetical protein
MVGWNDPSVGVLAQKVTAAGTVSWAPGGVVLATGTVAQNAPLIDTDGAGGGLVLWLDTGGSFLQRLTSAGTITSGWPAAGVAITTFTTASSLISDGSNGAIVSFSGVQGTDYSINAQRVASDGTVPSPWPGDGVLVCGGPGNRFGAQAVPDGNHGAIVTWPDFRSGGVEIYTARVLLDGTVSALASLVDAAVEPGLVRLHWYSPDRSVPSATVERAEMGGGYVALGGILADGEGHLRFEDRDVSAGITYLYRLAVPDGASIAYLGQVTVRVPSSVSFGIEGLRPNPSEGEASVLFALESGEPATLDVLDVTGRRVLTREVGMLGAGHHALSLPETKGLPAGIYALRLTQAGRTVAAWGSIVR